ncbi:uncharacterized protein LOC131942173 [Physella acuta]|uniref:uncharacterized protein LOC131942173 n=1 Tax=Physella acuta TaxID=109671 RepID=UPI0027DC776B|nr:uncharacterized protein LOC131942173 [Physella acuta]
MTEGKTKKLFQTSEVFYLSLQPRDPSQTSQCTVKSENTLNVSVLVLSSNTNLQIRCQEKLQYLNDSKTFSKISCVNAKQMSYTVSSDVFTMIQILVLQRDTIHINCDIRYDENTCTAHPPLGFEQLKTILICVACAAVVLAAIVLIMCVNYVCCPIWKRKCSGVDHNTYDVCYTKPTMGTEGAQFEEHPYQQVTNEPSRIHGVSPIIHKVT